MNRASTPTPERNKAYARGSRVNYLELKGLANKSDKQGSDYQVNKREHAKWRKTEKSMKESVKQIDELSKATKDSYVAKRGSQLSSMMYGSGKHYASLTGRQQKNAVKGIKRATGVKEEAEQIDELSKKTLASYVKGAHRSQGQHEWESGNKAAKGEYHQNKKYIKREMGIGRALNRLQKD